jgi:hypothetical protein
MMRTINLGGHSGCRILLFEGEQLKNPFVRKISSDINYNKRLKTQMKKQKDFKQGSVKAPLVLNDGYTDDGLYFFDMEYIQGITLAEYIKSLEVCKIHGLVDDIVSHIVPDTNSVSLITNTLAFNKKIDKLSQELLPLNNDVVNDAIAVLKTHDWHEFKQSFCHGDLTLENIIVKGDQLYLIDFLDSFYDCWMLDVSTLLQDVQTMWSYRKEEKININTLIRLIIFRDILIDDIKGKVGDLYVETYYALLLKLIRIFPYTKDQLTYDFLTEKTKSVLQIIQKNNDIIKAGIAK